MVEAMRSPLGMVHVLQMSSLDYKALWRIPSNWQGPTETLLQTPVLILGGQHGFCQ